MSGKSTFLRTLAVNAVLAQSIHTVCGSWTASLVRVHAAMRAVDATGAGVSTYAAEVASIAKLVSAVEQPGPPALFVLDEPFRGTNPTVRVPIVVAVLEYLGRGHLVAAATHDLDVANQLSSRFERAYFRESDDGRDDEPFDFKLRRGTAVTTNAVTLLERAGYPAAILDAVRAAQAAT
jgi:DNA mismatch repair ATPase MutS